MNRFEQALTPYMDRRVLAAWVGGSHAHGLASPDSDIDLHLVLAPEPDDILLGRADRTKGLHGPDITITTPIPLLTGLTKGAPNTLEALSLPDDCLLLDAGLLHMLAPLAGRLTSRNTIDMALGNVKGNLHLLARDGLDERKRRKLQGETMRLLASIGHVTAGRDTDTPWPCRLDADLDVLREIREHGMDDAELAAQLPDMLAYASSRRLHTPDRKTIRETERLVAGLMKGLVDGTTATFPMESVPAMLEIRFERHIRLMDGHPGF